MQNKGFTLNKNPRHLFTGGVLFKLYLQLE